ncbi:MAG: ABC transporter ATP-binding protein, partial [Treponema sp.]|nr:ABC transporter ATP-binding protein [Treponema sp.]
MLKEFIERWKESRAYRKSQIVAIVFSIALTAIVSVMPFAIRSIIEDVQTATFSLTTLINLVIVFFILISRSFLSFFSRILGSRMESVIGHEKRLNILNSILKATIHRKKTMDDTIVINRLLREVYCYSDLLGTFPVNVITNIIKILFAIIVLVQINVPLFLVSFFTIPIAMFLVNITKESMKNAWENQIKQWEGMDKLAREIFASYTLVKQMKCENEISSLFNKQNKMHFKSETHINKLSILTMELNAILSSALPLLCLLIGFVLTFIGRSDIGSVIAFYMYVN